MFPDVSEVLLITENSAEMVVDRRSGARRTASQAGESRAKRAIDVVGALVALVLFALLLAMIAAALLILDGRPILIKHRRIGKDGKPFSCLKFRSMIVDSDAVLVRHLANHPEAMVEWQASRKLRHDPRITPLGKVLRETSLDELPQLVNILRGEMSLVGPRPIVLDEAPLYGAAFADYQAVRPGLTGLWQCSGRNDVSYEQRVMLDRQYVRGWSVWGDVGIMLRTVPAVIRSRGVY